jgi:hypothetical protein
MKKQSFCFRIICVVLAALCVAAFTSCRRGVDDDSEAAEISTYEINNISAVGIQEAIEFSENYGYSYFHGRYTRYEDEAAERWVVNYHDARTIGIEKLQGEVRTDLISVKNVDIDGLFQKDGRCVAYGTKRLVYSEKPWIMLVDENGAKTEKVLDLPDAETIVTVIDDGGSGYYILTAINKYEPYILRLRISHITKRGQFQKNPAVKFKIDGYKGSIHDFRMCEDGFTVTVAADRCSAVALDKNGGLICNYICGEQDGHQEIRSAVIRNGVLYLSGVVYEKESERSSVYSYIDDTELLRTDEEYGSPFYSSETVTEAIRKALSAFLAAVDLETGKTLKYYKESGAVGGALTDGGNGIVWDLCMVSRAYYSPFTSSFSFECLCSVVQCRIGDDGELAEKAVTDFGVSETF